MYPFKMAVELGRRVASDVMPTWKPANLNWDLRSKKDTSCMQCIYTLISTRNWMYISTHRSAVHGFAAMGETDAEEEDDEAVLSLVI